MLDDMIVEEEITEEEIKMGAKALPNIEYREKLRQRTRRVSHHT